MNHASSLTFFFILPFCLLLSSCQSDSPSNPSSSPFSSSPSASTIDARLQSIQRDGLQRLHTQSLSLSNLRFSNTWNLNLGPEFPGALGSLTPYSEPQPFEVRFSLDLNCQYTSFRISSSSCGQYVSSSILLNPQANPTPPRYLQVSTENSNPFIAQGLRLQDASNQTFQYSLTNVTLESLYNGGRTTQLIALSNPQSFWGGDGSMTRPFRELSILGTRHTLGSSPGTLTLFDLQAYSNPHYDWALTRDEPTFTLPPSYSPPLSGINASYYKISESSIQLAAQAGFKVVRLDAFWELVEPHGDGQFNFDALDRILSLLDRYHMKALFILSYGHRSYPSVTTPEGQLAFLNYTQRLTSFSQNRNVLAFEIWNEPDNPTFWPNSDAQTYSILLQSTLQKIRQQDPSRHVLNGGASWFNFEYYHRLHQHFDFSNLDFVAVHGYRGLLTPPESLAGDWIRLQDLLSLDSRSLWITEWGHSSTGLPLDAYGTAHDSRARIWQSNMILRHILTQYALGVPFYCLYELVDSGNQEHNSEHNFGLLTSTLTPKISYYAVKTLHESISNAQYRGLVQSMPPGTHAMKWTHLNRQLYILWNERSDLPRSIWISLQAKVTSLSQAPLELTTFPSEGLQNINLTSSTGPLLIEYP